MASEASEASVHLDLDHDEALVLFEFLAREIDENDGVRLKPLAAHEGELWALNGLHGRLERLLAEPFAEDYPAVLARARETLVARRGPWPD